MESLLRWSIENSTGPGAQASGSTSSDYADRQLVGSSGSTAVTSAAPAPPRQHLDPGIIDHILGKSDGQLMKEALTVAVDRNRSEDERVQALDDFEMLVEQIDNANNIAKLEMWSPLQDLLTASDSSAEISTQVLWIIGTALQNNPKAQLAYMNLSPPALPTIVGFLNASQNSGQRSKAIYALSGLLKHNKRAVDDLDDGMWDVIKSAVSDSDIGVRRKVIFMLNALLIPTSILTEEQSAENVGQVVHPNSHESHLSSPSSVNTSESTVAALESRGILEVIVDALVEPLPHGPDGENMEEDVELVERVIRFLHTYTVSCDRRLSKPEQAKVLEYLNRPNGGALGLTVEELRELRASMMKRQ